MLHLLVFTTATPLFNTLFLIKGGKGKGEPGVTVLVRSWHHSPTTAGVRERGLSSAEALVGRGFPLEAVPPPSRPARASEPSTAAGAL